MNRNEDSQKSNEKSQPIIRLIWLNIFNAELSPKKYWRKPRFQEMREEGYYTLHCNNQNDSCIKLGSGKTHFNVSLIARSSHKDSVL